MPLTRDFKQTVMARAARDAGFRKALFTEALNACMAGDADAGRAMLRDLINATVGFQALAEKTRIAPKSLHRMLSPKGNPTTENFFGIVRSLQKSTHVRLRVSAFPGARAARPSAALSVRERAPTYRAAPRKK